MQHIATDRVASSVCRCVGLSETVVSPEKTAEPIEMPFKMWTGAGAKRHVFDGVQIPAREGAISRARGPAQDMEPCIVAFSMPRTWPDMFVGRYTQSDSAGGSTGTVQMPTGLGVLYFDHCYY